MSKFETVQMPGKGLGIKATENISCGELILEEKPLLRVRDTEALHAVVCWKFGALSESDARQFMTLSNGRSPEHFDLIQKEFNEEGMSEEEAKKATNVCAIFSTNAFGDENETQQAVFLQAVRFNHSCKPDAQWDFDVSRNVLSVHAIREIKTGEEINLAYVTPDYCNAERRLKLRSVYGFNCECVVCSNEEALARRDRTNTLISRIIETDSRDICEIFNVIEALRAEGLEGWNLGRWYRDLSGCWYNAEDYELALHYSNLALRCAVASFGVHHQMVKNLQSDVEHLAAKQ